ncbi:MAG: MBL fold metallo-hydrolase [Oscillospiraceae bacterium]|nr:MBL fold metallo-hydrolase [Oscillospiraceae bacterium]
MKLTVLGTRGSMAVSEKGRGLFGGSTSCYMVQAGDDCVFLDAGSGLLSAPVLFQETPVILLSHLHLDHVLGLGMYARLLIKGKKTVICVPAESDAAACAALNGLFSPPYWPVSLEEYRGDVEIRCAVTPMQVGAIHVDSIPGNHPSGCLIYRLSCGGRSLVYATDFEHDEESFDRLAQFAAGTDLLLYDGQYDEDEYLLNKGFGHSTANKGVELMERCGAKRMLLVHHSPSATDAQLLHRQGQLGRENVTFAREGEVLSI